MSDMPIPSDVPVSTAEPTLSVAAYRETAANIEAEVGKVIVGQRKVVRFVLVAILAGGHALLEGVPGLGKTMLIRTLADALRLAFSRIQFTPDLMPADITGTEILEEGDGRRAFRFQRGPVFANLVLADEINRATPKTQSALLEAMQEHTVTVANETYRLPEPFFVLATQNPLEMEGTYPLPEAQLDRFLFKVNVPFPSATDLTEILSRTTGRDAPQARAAADGARISAMQALTRQVPIPTHVSQYISRLIVATHPQSSPAPLVGRYVRYGASPRGAQALVLGAKVTALLAGRYNVSFDDVAAVAAPALRHRLLLNFEGQADDIKTADIVADLLQSIPRDDS
jgi:MoxR-like ATPase